MALTPAQPYEPKYQSCHPGPEPTECKSQREDYEQQEKGGPIGLFVLAGHPLSPLQSINDDFNSSDAAFSAAH